MTACDAVAEPHAIMPPYFCYHPNVTVLTVSVLELEGIVLDSKPETQAIRSPLALLQWLHTYHIVVDTVIAEFNGLWKFSSLNGCFCVAAGVLADAHDTHTELLVRLSQRLKAACAAFNLPNGEALRPSFSLHTGDAVSGVLGSSRLDYEIIGSVVQVSRSLAKLVPPAAIVVTQNALDALANQQEWQACGTANVCGAQLPCYALTDGAASTTLLCQTPERTVTLLSPPTTELLSWGKGNSALESLPAQAAAGAQNGHMASGISDQCQRQQQLMNSITHGGDQLCLAGQQPKAAATNSSWWLDFTDEGMDKSYLNWLAQHVYFTDVRALIIRAAFSLSPGLQSRPLAIWLVPLMCSLVPLYLAIAFRHWFQRRRTWVLMGHALAACLCAVHLQAPSIIARADAELLSTSTGLFKATGADTVMFNVLLQLPFRQHFLLQLLSMALLVPLLPATCARAASVLASGDQSACMLIVAACWHLGVAGVIAAALCYAIQAMHLQRFLGCLQRPVDAPMSTGKPATAEELPTCS